MPDRDISVSRAPALNPVRRDTVGAHRSGNMGRDGYDVLSRANSGADEFGFGSRNRRALAERVYPASHYGMDD